MKAEVCIEKKVLEFYRRIVYGSTYDKNNKNEDNIVKWCFNAAWKAMASHTLKFDNDNNKNIDTKLQEKIKENFKNENLEIFKNWKYHLLDNNKIREMITKCYNLSCTKYFNFTYGQAQKLVNMFFKHLYTFKDELCIEDNSFNACDCPIDSGILYDLYKKKNMSWSKLTETEYDKIQDDISEKIKQENYKNKLDYDFGAWK